MKHEWRDQLRTDAHESAVLLAEMPVRRPVRLAYLVSHPIQYQAPLLRRIAQEPGIDLTVFFGSDFSVKGYQDKGFDVKVKWDVPLLDGYNYEFLPKLRDNGTAGILSPISLGLTRRLAGDGHAAGFDVLWVHGYSTINQLRAMFAAKSLGIPVLLRAESWLRDRPRASYKLPAKRVYFEGLKHLVDGVLAIGTLNRRYWEHYLGDGFPIFFMPYSVDNAFFQERARDAAKTRHQLLAELGLEPQRPVILFASKLQARKRCDDLIAAYAMLPRTQTGEPDSYLVIVGDGKERGRLERQAAETGLRSIRFCGFRNQGDLPRFFDLASVFVLPSRHEPWGLIVNEVMNAGRAIIVSDDVGCQPDLVTDGVEGCVYPAGDVSALAAALTRVLDKRGTAGEMGQRARARINEWNFEADVRGLVQAIEHVTRRRIRVTPQDGAAG